MSNAKQYVLSRFPGASVRQIGQLFKLEGVPGLVSTGISEGFTWTGAAQELQNPILDSSRKKVVKDQVLQAFNSLGGRVNQPMALAMRLESLGYTSADSAAAINEVLATGFLAQTEAGGIHLT